MKPCATLFALISSGFCSVCNAVPAQEIPKSAVRAVSPADMMQWGLGLLCVLAVFFICVWVMRKMPGLASVGRHKLRVVGGLSLGLREKVVLLEVGNKQLVLGITPGRIETLLVLDEADCLKSEISDQDGDKGAFARKLRLAMKGRTDG